MFNLVSPFRYKGWSGFLWQFRFEGLMIYNIYQQSIFSKIIIKNNFLKNNLRNRMVYYIFATNWFTN